MANEKFTVVGTNIMIFGGVTLCGAKNAIWKLNMKNALNVIRILFQFQKTVFTGVQSVRYQL